MSTPQPPPVRSNAAPGALRRAIGGAFLAIGLFLLYVLLPSLLFGSLGPVQVRTTVGLAAITAAGVALTILGVARYMLKPTRAFGPTGVVYALALTAYLLWLASHSPIELAYRGASLSVSYGAFLLAVLAVPLLSLGAAIVTTFEDALNPGERLPFDFPPRAER